MKKQKGRTRRSSVGKEEEFRVEHAEFSMPVWHPAGHDQFTVGCRGQESDLTDLDMWIWDLQWV